MELFPLTHFSHGAGCGCKLSPEVLSTILTSVTATPVSPHLIVGNHTNDDAAVYDLGNGTALISTTDFFMPIVDSAYDFGRIASANALSDVYAMGGTPILALGILGWTIKTLPVDVASEVLRGSRDICALAGIDVAGGHSIDSPEPIFGLSVNGLVPLAHIKRNSTARANSLIYLTKPLGVGIVTTAQKHGIATQDDVETAVDSMTRLNTVGTALGGVSAVSAMTDITGFGLVGHTLEVCRASNVNVTLEPSAFKVLPSVDMYVQQNAIPGGTKRNWLSYGHEVLFSDENEITLSLSRSTSENRYDSHLQQISLLCDPQTSGGLLIIADESGREEVEDILTSHGLADFATPIGRTHKRENTSNTHPYCRII